MAKDTFADICSVPVTRGVAAFFPLGRLGSGYLVRDGDPAVAWVYGPQGARYRFWSAFFFLLILGSVTQVLIVRYDLDPDTWYRGLCAIYVVASPMPARLRLLRGLRRHPLAPRNSLLGLLVNPFDIFASRDVDADGSCAVAPWSHAARAYDTGGLSQAQTLGIVATLSALDVAALWVAAPWSVFEGHQILGTFGWVPGWVVDLLQRTICFGFLHSLGRAAVLHAAVFVFGAPRAAQNVTADTMSRRELRWYAFLSICILCVVEAQFGYVDFAPLVAAAALNATALFACLMVAPFFGDAAARHRRVGLAQGFAITTVAASLAWIFYFWQHHH